MRIVNWIKNLTIIGFSLLALVAVVANFNLPVKGFRLLVVQSGSMEPAIGVGSIVLTKPTSDFLSPISSSKFSQGDVITFSSGSSLVSHRVIDSKYENGEFFYKTKGDANQQPDNTLVSEKDTVGKVIFKAPTLGKFVQFLKTPLGYFLMILIPSLYVIITELFVLWRELRKTNENLSFSVPSKALTPVIVLIFAAFYFVGGTASYFTDTATSSSNVLQTASVFPGAPGSVVINEIMWMGSSENSSDEWIELRNMTSSTIDLSNWVIENLGSGTNNVVIPVGKSIPPNGFFLIAQNSKSTGAHNVDPDLVTTVGLTNNPSEQLVLRSSLGGTIIDTADNSSGGWFAGVSGTGQNPDFSMERNSTPGDGTVGTNWHTATSATNMDPGAPDIATPRAANSL